MTAFIDDVIVEIEIEEGYNEITEKILGRMAESNLFLKLEKYMWKVRKMEFLGAIIGPDSIKIEKEKVQEL